MPRARKTIHIDRARGVRIVEYGLDRLAVVLGHGCEAIWVERQDAWRMGQALQELVINDNGNQYNG